MEKEKVIKGLECCAVNHVDCYKLDDCPYKNAENNDTAVCVDILMRDALELLKAQEPVGPKLGGDAGPFETMWYQCGACSGQIDPGDNYCRSCGRAVKWE